MIFHCWLLGPGLRNSLYDHHYYFYVDLSAARHREWHVKACYDYPLHVTRTRSLVFRCTVVGLTEMVRQCVLGCHVGRKVPFDQTFAFLVGNVKKTASLRDGH